MGKFVLRLVILLSVAAAGLAVFGTGLAAAKDPYIGRTYSEVAAKISDGGGTPVISTVVGSELETSDCIVQSWHKSSYVKDDNFDHDRKQYLLALNCTAKLAGAGKPGNSLASPSGRAEKAVEDKIAGYNEKPARCEKYLATCKRICEQSGGLCSKEVTALFSSAAVS